MLGTLPSYPLKIPFRTVSLGSALAIRLRSKPHRLVVPHMPVGLLSCRLPKATREKSAPGLTTPFVPTPAHHEPADHLLRIGLKVGTQEGPGLELSFRIAHQHPA